MKVKARLIANIAIEKSKDMPAAQKEAVLAEKDGKVSFLSVPFFDAEGKKIDVYDANGNRLELRGRIRKSNSGGLKAFMSFSVAGEAFRVELQGPKEEKEKEQPNSELANL